MLNRINKSLCLLLSVLLILSSVSYVSFAADYEAHWAKDAISSLLSSGVISGDADGSIRPDDKILRAEYIKVINKYFGYSDMSGGNFPDADSSKWYYNDLAIAKTAGYITGDANGNANPESYITRAEVCVILSRILKLTENADVTFSDSENIPDWAKGHIGAMVSAGLISGYSDGTVKAENNITRAEAFALVSKTTPKASQLPTESTNVGNSGNTSSMIVVTPSGGGGGYDNSEPDSIVGEDSSKATILLDSFVEADYSVQFKTENAEYVTLKFEIGTEEIEVYTDDIKNQPADNVFSGNLMNKFKEVLVDKMDEDEIAVAVSAMAKAKKGYTDSDYISVAEFKYTFDSVAIPEIEAKLDYKSEEDMSVIASWQVDENALSYEAKVYKKDSEGAFQEITDTEFVDLSEISKGKIVIKAEGSVSLEEFLTYEYKLEIKGVGQGLIKTSETVCEFSPPIERVNKPVLAEAIDYDLNKFTVTWDIDDRATSYEAKVLVDDKEVDSELAQVEIEDGKVTVSGVNLNDFYSNVYNVTVKAVGNPEAQLGDSESDPKTVDITAMSGTGAKDDPYVIRSGLQFASVFADGGENVALAADKNAYFKQNNDIIIEDYTNNGKTVYCKYDGNGNSITINNYYQGANYDGLFSQLNGKVENLTLEKGATIVGDGKVGGFAGYCNAGQVINCVNKTDIESTGSYVGGIVGQTRAGVIVNCVNTGNVSSELSAVGGITGWTENNLTGGSFILYCANYGSVSATYEKADGVAGILGKATQLTTIEKCFNAGAITSPYSCGAIIGVNNAGGYNITVNDCFNTGVLTNGGGLIIGTYNDNASMNFSVNRFYDISNSQAPLYPETAVGRITIEGTGLVLGADDVTSQTILDAYAENPHYEVNSGYEYPNFVKNAQTIEISAKGYSYDIENIAYEPELAVSLD